jgi:uncharacterized integral membrane protein
MEVHVWIVRMLLFLVLVVAVTGFAMLNSDASATVKVWPNVVFYDVPLVLLLFEAFVVGALVWFVVSIFHEITLRAAMRKIKRENADLQQEIAGLKSISLDEIDRDEAPLG